MAMGIASLHPSYGARHQARKSPHAAGFFTTGPISRGRLCPKGSASAQLVTTPSRLTKVRYRRPFGTEWEDLDLDVAMEMIADRVMKTRDESWQEFVGDPGSERRTRRCMGIGSLGGATLDNEENYLMRKLYTAMGAVQIENQARI